MSELTPCPHCAELLFTGASTCPHCACHVAEGSTSPPLPLLMVHLLARHGAPADVGAVQVPPPEVIAPEPAYGIPEPPPPPDFTIPDEPMYGIPDIAPDWREQ